MDIPVKRWSTLNAKERQQLISRSSTDIDAILPSVKQIIEDVRRRGDEALLEYTKRFDCPAHENLSLTVAEEDFNRAEKSLSADVKEALDFCIENVHRYHRGQKPDGMEMKEIRTGVFAGERWTPVPSAGIYVPRGRGSFPSMLYMLAVPAVIAGVSRLCIATPPDSKGEIDAACLYAAERCGVKTVYRMSGAQSLAALAYGTGTVEPVSKVVGPGSKYIAAAKQLLAGIIDPGPPAGPSESIILADDSADIAGVVLDLLTEAEHGSDSSAVLVTTSEDLASGAAEILPRRIEAVPEPRKSFLRDVFSGYGALILVSDIEEGAEVVNMFAPEHLQLRLSDNSAVLSKIQNAGEILIGPFTPFTLANYAAGANAVLPTGGTAKTWGPVSVRDFMKCSTVIKAGPEGYTQLAKHARVLAEYEDFPCHADAVKSRSVLS